MNFLTSVVQNHNFMTLQTQQEFFKIQENAAYKDTIESYFGVRQLNEVIPDEAKKRKEEEKNNEQEKPDETELIDEEEE